jgi:hypothetical protein
MKVVGCITIVRTKFTIKFHTNSKNEDSCNSGCFEQKITLQSQLSPISDVKLKEKILKNRWFMARQDNNGSMTTFLNRIKWS